MSDPNGGTRRSASAPAPERADSVGRRKHFSDGSTLNLFGSFVPTIKPSGRRRSVSPRCSLRSGVVVEGALPSPRRGPGTAVRRDTVDLLTYREGPIDSVLLPAGTPGRSPRQSMRAQMRSPSNGKSPRNENTNWITNPFEDHSWDDIKRDKPRRQSTILSVWVNKDRDTCDVDRPRCQFSPHRKTRILSRDLISGIGLSDHMEKDSRRRVQREDSLTSRVLSPEMLPKASIKRRSRSLGAKMEKTYQRGPSPSSYFSGGMSDAGSQPPSPSPFQRTTFCNEDGSLIPSPSPQLNPHNRYAKGKFDHLKYRSSSILDPLNNSDTCRKKSLPFVPSFMTDGIASRPYGISPPDPQKRFKTSSKKYVPFAQL